MSYSPHNPYTSAQHAKGHQQPQLSRANQWEQGRADRLAGKPCSSANGAHLEGWYSISNPCSALKSALPCVLLAALLFVVSSAQGSGHKESSPEAHFLNCLLSEGYTLTDPTGIRIISAQDRYHVHPGSFSPDDDSELLSEHLTPSAANREVDRLRELGIKAYAIPVITFSAK